MKTSNFYICTFAASLLLASLLPAGVSVATAKTLSPSVEMKSESAQYQSLLKHATLTVDHFDNNPSDSWSASADGGNAPILSFSPSGSTTTLNLTWADEPDGSHVAATLSLGAQEWSGYSTLEMTLSTGALSENPWLSLSNDDGQSYRVNLAGPGVTRSPAEPGWTKVSVSLEPLNPSHPPRHAPKLGKLPALGSVTHLTLGVDIQDGSESNSLQVSDIHLTGSKGFYGPSTYVDTSFYGGQNWMDVAKKVHDQGFTAVHLIVLNLSEDQTQPLQAFHAYHIPVALSIFPTTNLAAYNAHPEWRQQSLGGQSQFDWRVYLSPSNQQFVTWLDNQVEDEFQRYAYDGFELTEPWYEVWGGPYQENPSHQYYMDISPSAVMAFKEEYGVDPIGTLFVKGNDGSYALNSAMADSHEYQQWQQFRVDTLDRFLAGLLNRAKHARPGITSFVTYLSDVRIDNGKDYNKVREYQAQDLDAIQKKVKPDVIVLQSPAQDWGQSNLAPNYIKDYASAYLPRIRPDIHVIVQTDVGSTVKRNFQWLREFSATAEQSGFDGYQVYEWSVAGWNVKPTTLQLGDFTDGQIDGWLPYGSDMSCDVTFPTDETLGHPVAHVAFGNQSSGSWAVFERYGLHTTDWAQQGVTDIGMWFKGDGSDGSAKFVVQDLSGAGWVAYIPLKDTSWHWVQLPFSSFQPYAGDASGPVDVGNIERVKFVVEGAPLTPAYSFSVYDVRGVVPNS